MELNGKIVLVAGGAGGIGLGITRALADEGCKIALADAVKTAGGKFPCVSHACDITDREQVSKLFEWLDSKLGPVDILVNSAGINVGDRMISAV